MFKTMRLGTRLMLAFALLIGLSFMVSAFGIRGLYKLNEANDELYQRELLGISYVKEANINLIYAGRARVQYSQAGSEADRQAARAQFDKAVGDMRGWLGKAKPMFYTPEGQAQFNNINGLIDAWLPAADAYFDAEAKQPLAGADAGLRALIERVQAQNLSLDTQFSALAHLKEQNGEAAAQAGTATFQNVSALMVAMSLFSAVCGVVVGVLITRGVTRALGGEPGDVAAVANAVAAGDLTTVIDTSRAAPGSVVTAMNHMQQSLRRLVSQVRSSSDSIATGSSQIATGNADLSQRTEEQASNLQQTAASMEELTSTVKANADIARQAAQLAGSASDAAGQGGRVVAQVEQTMDGITSSSKKISDIIGVIDGIAFQTNILALNAAVEAARAGEQGRGFAVVAGEVRTLAQRAATAAKEIKSLITESVEKVEAGSLQVAEAGRAMGDIVGQVQRVNDLLSDISAATVEQTQGISQVGDAVNQLDQVTQQNAALVEESAAAADSLSQQAARLVEAVRVFRLDEGEGQLLRPVIAPSPSRKAPAAAPHPVRPAVAREPASQRLPAPALATADGGDDWTAF